jgi:cytochrome c
MSLRFGTVLTALLIFFLVLSCETEQKRILVYSSSANGDTQVKSLDALLQLCRDKNILVDTTSSPAYLTEDTLQHYHSIVFAETSPTELDYRQQNDLERYIQAGGGLFVINANTDTILNWPWFRALTDKRPGDDENPWSSRYDGGHVYFAELNGVDQLDRVFADGLDNVISGTPDNSDAPTLRVP